jgi:hypothetical protein
MNGQELLSQLRTQLVSLVADRQCIPPLDPIHVSPWIAMAILQKGIRRGRSDLALRAAATLLLDAPDRLWRRCGAIAFEDVGVADPGVVGLVTVALASKSLRSSLGGEWGVASLVVSLLSEANKCRATDDLVMCAERHPAFARARQELAELPIQSLLDIVVGTSPLIERGLALWYALGTDRRTSGHLVPRRGQPQAVFDHLCEVGFPHTVVEVAREGYRKTRTVLCPFVALLSAEQRPVPPTIEDDKFPPEEMIGSVPSWALDMFSREGRFALKCFAEGGSETAKWVRDHVPAPERVSFLGDILFVVEGGQMSGRLRWPTADQLRRLSERECQAHCTDVADVRESMRADIPILNRVRSSISAELSHAR